MPAADNRPDPAPVAAQLLGTLEREREALDALDRALAGQLDALRSREPAAFDAATDTAAEAVAALGRLRPARDRQTHLLARLLGRPADDETPDLLPLADALPDRAQANALRAVRSSLRARAEAVQARCAELEFALGVAVRLGRELLQVLQPPDGAGRVYTASGSARPASPRSLVDHTG